MSMITGGIDAYLNTSAADIYGSGMSGKIKNVGSSSTADELKEVCKEFESYFMEQVYKEMFKSVGKSEGGDSSLASLVDYFKDTAIQTLATQTTDQNGGPLAQQLYKQMKRNYGITEEE